MGGRTRRLRNIARRQQGAQTEAPITEAPVEKKAKKTTQKKCCTGTCRRGQEQLDYSNN